MIIFESFSAAYDRRSLKFRNTMNAMHTWMHRIPLVGRGAICMMAGAGLLGFASAALSAPVVVTGNVDPAAEAQSTSATMAPAASTARARTPRAHARVPLHFEANAGQFGSAAKFGARGRGYQLLLDGNRTVMVLQKQSATPHADAQARATRSRIERARDSARRVREAPVTVAMRFEGANPNPEVAGEDPLPGKSHYFIGNDASKWRTNVAHHAKVRYRGVYPGIDMLYYGSEGRLEYDWIVAPGADPHRIVEVFDGATKLSIDPSGDLYISAAGSGLWQKKPALYQQIGGERVPVEGGYVLLGPNSVGFKVGRYDASRPLVIDPVLEYSTHLGGSGNDRAFFVAASPTGEAYVAGETFSADFPVTSTSGAPSSDSGAAFVTKLNGAGDGIVYSAYFGGSNVTSPLSVAVGDDGSAYVVGVTLASDFPANTTIGAFGSSFATFVVKLVPDGSAFAYSTLIGSSATRNGIPATVFGISIVPDSSGAAFIAGFTDAPDFPTTPGALQSSDPQATTLVESGFVSKLTPAGDGFVYSTLYGDPPGGATEITWMTADASGNAYVIGQTASRNLPLVNPFQGPPASIGVRTGFFAKIDPAGASLLYASYLGGSGFDNLNGVAVDAQGNIVIGGSTSSLDFPQVNPLGVGTIGTQTAFVAKVDPTGTVLFSMPLGVHTGSNGVALDPVGNIYLTGFAESGLPVVGSLNAAVSGTGFDAFLSKFAPDGSALLLSTRIGGNSSDVGFSVATDAIGGVYVTGETDSSDFPVSGALQGALNGPSDGFILKVSDPAQAVVLLSSKNPSRTGEAVTLTAAVTDPGATGSVAFFDGGNNFATFALDARGFATVVTSTLAIGSHSIIAAYSGDATHPAANSSALVQVVNPNPQDTTTVLTVSPTTLASNQTATLTATVTGVAGTPTGVVTFFDGASNIGGVALTAGSATTTLLKPTGGQHTLTARYGGDSLNKPSVSAPAVITVIGPPTVSISAPVDGAVFEYPATVTITALASAPSGASVVEVDILVNGTQVAALTTAPYTFALANAPPGVYQLTARAVDNFGQASVSAPVLVRIHIPSITYYHQDLQGNVVATTDDFGQVVYTENYLPFGGRLIADPAGQVAQANGNRLWFHGKAQDESTGLSYFGARYYDPAIGRFMGVDSFGFQENNIHSFNRYAYGNNNPYRYIDVDGRFTIPEILVGVGIIVLGGYLIANNSQPALPGKRADTDASGSNLLTTPGVPESGRQLPGFSRFIDKLRNIFSESKTPEEQLMPGGNPIGEQGTSQGIRVLPGGSKAAEDLFGELSKGGKVVDKPGYPGTLVELPNSGGTVGIRPRSKSGDTAIDVNVPGLKGVVDKIHFPD